MCTSRGVGVWPVNINPTPVYVPLSHGSNNQSSAPLNSRAWHSLSRAKPLDTCHGHHNWPTDTRARLTDPFKLGNTSPLLQQNSHNIFYKFHWLAIKIMNISNRYTQNAKIHVKWRYFQNISGVNWHQLTYILCQQINFDSCTSCIAYEEIVFAGTQLFHRYAVTYNDDSPSTGMLLTRNSLIFPKEFFCLFIQFQIWITDQSTLCKMYDISRYSEG